MFDSWPRIVFMKCFKSRVRNVLACVKTWTGPERGREWKQEESRSHSDGCPRMRKMSALTLSVPRFFSRQSRRRRPLPDPTMMTERYEWKWSSFGSKEKDEAKSTKLISSELERRSVGKLANFPKSSDSINFLIVSSSLSKQTVSINGERERAWSGGGKGRAGGGDGWLSEREDWLLTTGCRLKSNHWANISIF